MKLHPDFDSTLIKYIVYSMGMIFILWIPDTRAYACRSNLVPATAISWNVIAILLVRSCPVLVHYFFTHLTWRSNERAAHYFVGQWGITKSLSNYLTLAQQLTSPSATTSRPSIQPPTPTNLAPGQGRRPGGRIVITIGDHRRPHMVSDGCAVYYIKLILDHFDSTIFFYWHSKGIPNSQYHNGTSIQYHLTTIGDHVSTNGDHLTTMIW